VALWGHQREAHVVGVEHEHAGLHGYALERGVDQHHLAGGNAGHREEEAVLRRLEGGEVGLPHGDRLLGRGGAALQTYAVGLLPELAEALERADHLAAVDVEVHGLGR